MKGPLLLLNFIFFLFIVTVISFNNAKSEEFKIQTNVGIAKVDDSIYDLIMETNHKSIKEKIIAQCDATTNSMSFFFYTSRKPFKGSIGVQLHGITLEGKEFTVYDSLSSKVSFRVALNEIEKKEMRYFYFYFYDQKETQKTYVEESIWYTKSTAKNLIFEMEKNKVDCDMNTEFSSVYPLSDFKPEL